MGPCSGRAGLIDVAVGSVGPIHFASSDIQGAGYMHVDGGVRIGDATARRISERLTAEA